MSPMSPRAYLALLVKAAQPAAPPAPLTPRAYLAHLLTRKD